MSEKPPRKKLRQTSLMDMFKLGTKDSEVMENPRAEKKLEEVSPESNTRIKEPSGSSDIAIKIEDDEKMDSKPEEICDVTSDAERNANEDVIFSRSESKGKSPMKVKTYLSGKTKKRKHKNEPKPPKSELAWRDANTPVSAGYRGNTDHQGSSSEKFKKDSPKGSSETTPTKATWRGYSISSMKVLTNGNRNVPSVHPSADHTVLVKLPLPESAPPEPHPSSYSDVWDQHHVRMPCSPKSLYPLSSGNDSLAPRWSVIYKALQREITCVADLQRTILEYNSRYAEKWNFKGLQHLLKQDFEEEEHDYFFKHTLPAIINLALDLPNQLTQPPPLLTRHSTHSITLSQLQIASLLANAFFCTYPRRNAKGGDTEYASYPDINFNRLFSHKEKRSLEKLKCLINYFRRVTKKKPDGLVTFTRQFVNANECPSWESSSHHLPELHIDSTGLIEEKEGLLQVDFANKFIGGGVLGLGCVQEEIRFVLSPELIVSRLFTQVLDKTEALIITGTEQYNCSTGYASNFCWAGSHHDSTQRDVWRRRLCQVVAIDALRFTHPKVQYRPNLIKRELDKVYAGFRVLKGSAGCPIGVATGNWGCGAFNGNPRLKSLLQLAACGYVGRDVAYFTFGDEKLRNDLSVMHLFLKENNITVGQLVQTLMHYGRREWSDGSDLYHYIYHTFSYCDSDTDGESEDITGSSNKNDRRNWTSKQIAAVDNGTSKKNISEYFKKTESPRCSTSHSNNIDSEASSSNSSSVQPPQTSERSAKEGNLTQEKIVEVLKECDRLVKDQKKKNQENSSEVPVDNRFCIDSNDTISDSSKNPTENSKEIAEKYVPKTSKSEPVNLLSCLDDIDKQLGSHK